MHEPTFFNFHVFVNALFTVMGVPSSIVTSETKEARLHGTDVFVAPVCWVFDAAVVFVGTGVLELSCWVVAVGEAAWFCCAAAVTVSAACVKI